MVSKNEQLVFAALQVGPLNYKWFNNNQKLIVVSFVLGFGWNYFMQMVGY